MNTLIAHKQPPHKANSKFIRTVDQIKKVRNQNPQSYCSYNYCKPEAEWGNQNL